LGSNEAGAGGKGGNRGTRIKPEPQPATIIETTVPGAWDQHQHHQPESPSMEDHQSSDSDLSDALTLARERLLISHALDNMAKLMAGDVRYSVIFLKPYFFELYLSLFTY
jgi:hypothetical protein